MCIVKIQSGNLIDIIVLRLFYISLRKLSHLTDNVKIAMNRVFMTFLKGLKPAECRYFYDDMCC